MLDILITVGTVYLVCALLASLIVMVAIWQQWKRFDKKWNEMNESFNENRNWSTGRKAK